MTERAERLAGDEEVLGKEHPATGETITEP